MDSSQITFTKASAVQKRVKIFMWGASGVGKTTLALSFPKPVMIDMESGSESYGDSFKFDVLQTRDADEVRAAIMKLKFTKHPYTTVVIDPITIFWDVLILKWTEKYRKLRTGDNKANKGEFYDLQPGDWNNIKAEYKELLADVLSLDMNVVVTAREKTKYRDGSFMISDGETFDAEKHTDYNFDVVLRLFVSNRERHIEVRKDRSNKLPDKPFPVDYKAFETAWGKDALDRKPVAFAYATEEQQGRVAKLVTELKIAKATFDTRLKTYGATSLKDLSEVNAKIVIEKLEATAKTQKEKKDAEGKPE